MRWNKGEAADQHEVVGPLLVVRGQGEQTTVILRSQELQGVSIFEGSDVVLPQQRLAVGLGQQAEIRQDIVHGLAGRPSLQQQDLLYSLYDILVGHLGGL